MTRQKLLGVTLAALFVAACGGSSPDTAGLVTPAGQAVIVATSPAEADIPPGGKFQFASQVSGTAFTEVAWSVAEADGGTIDATGLYTAPAIEGTYHVRANSKIASVTSFGTSVVRVKKGAVAPVLVAVDPATATVPAGGSHTFAAAVTGTTTRTVTWTVQGGPACGSVSAAGVYTAPNAGATCTVVATSAADATKSGTATVTVTPAPVIAVSVTPANASLLAGGTVTFTATVTGTTAGQSSAVVWSVPAGAGTVNASTGVYVAPATAGAYVVTATSVADGSKKATATVTVTTSPVTIAISPSTATLDACLGRQFTATVGNTSNTNVTWTITEAGGGTVTNGAYVSPSTAGTYHVVAVSQADPTRTATATITVGPEKVQSVSVTPGSGSLQANGTLAFSALVTTTCGTFAAQ